MTKKLIANGFVVINSGLELNIFNSFWLIQNKILEERDLINDHVFTKNLVRLDFKDYEITLDSNSVVLTMNQRENHQVDVGIDRYLKLLKNIKNTFHLSCGINFNWILDELETEEFRKLSKTLFFVEENPLYKSFETDDSGFGAYLTKICKDARLKLDIKPVHSFLDKGFLNFNFNFHRELEDNINTDELANYLLDWKFYKSESESLINTI